MSEDKPKKKLDESDDEEKKPKKKLDDSESEEEEEEQQPQAQDPQAEEPQLLELSDQRPQEVQEQVEESKESPSPTKKFGLKAPPKNNQHVLDNVRNLNKKLRGGQEEEK